MLAGYSRGGSAAILAAEQLDKEKVNVDALFLFDAVARHRFSGGEVIPKRSLQPPCPARPECDDGSEVRGNVFRRGARRQRFQSDAADFRQYGSYLARQRRSLACQTLPRIARRPGRGRLVFRHGRCGLPTASGRLDERTTGVAARLARIESDRPPHPARPPQTPARWNWSRDWLDELLLLKHDRNLSKAGPANSAISISPCHDLARIIHGRVGGARKPVQWCVTRTAPKQAVAFTRG